MFELHSRSSSSIENENTHASLLAHGLDEMGQKREAALSSIVDLNPIGEVVKLATFSPFDYTLDALNQYSVGSEASCESRSQEGTSTRAMSRDEQVGQQGDAIPAPIDLDAYEDDVIISSPGHLQSIWTEEVS